MPLHKLVGHNAALTVEQKQSQSSDRVYANVINVAPPHKSAPKIAPRDYQRSEHWEKRRAEYAEGAAKFRAANAPKPPREPEEVLADVDDDLPF